MDKYQNFIEKTYNEGGQTMKNQAKILSELPAGVYITSYSGDNLVAIENVTKDSIWSIAIKLDIQQEFMGRETVIVNIAGERIKL